MAEVTGAFRCYEEALNDNDVTTLTTSFWTSPLTVRFTTPSPPFAARGPTWISAGP
jgi:hypothetical protein